MTRTAWRRQVADGGDAVLTGPGSPGVLDAVLDLVLSTSPEAVQSLPGGTLVLVAAEHAVARHGVSAYPGSTASEVLAATRAGESFGASIARAAGLAVSAHDAVARDRQGDLVSADALTPADLARLIGEGEAVGERVAADGLVCLGDVGMGNTTAAAAMASAMLGLDADAVIGPTHDFDSAMLARRHEIVYTAVTRARAERPATLDDPLVPLGVLGGPDIAFLTGVILGAAGAGAPVVLDGIVTSIAALAAVRLNPSVRSSLVAGHLSCERAHGAVLSELGLVPLLELRLGAGEGVGACLAAQLILSVLAARQPLTLPGGGS